MKRKQLRHVGNSIEPMEVRYLLSATIAVGAALVPTAPPAIVSPPAPPVSNDDADLSADVAATPALPPPADQILSADFLASLQKLSNQDLDALFTELSLHGDDLTALLHRDQPPPTNSNATPHFVVDLQSPAAFGANAPFGFPGLRDDARFAMPGETALRGSMPPSALTHDADFRAVLQLGDGRDLGRDLPPDFDLMLFRSLEAVSSTLASAATIPGNGHVATYQTQALLIGDVDGKNLDAANREAVANQKEDPSAPAVALRSTSQFDDQSEAPVARRLRHAGSKNFDGDDQDSEQSLANQELIAETDEPSLVPQQAAGVRGYLGIDWNGIESRMAGFLNDLEAAGSKFRSQHGSATQAAFLWVSVTAVATFVLEWACRKNRVPVLERNVYGVLNDRSSVSRHKEYKSGETHRVS